MTTPEKVLVRRRLQILSDQARIDDLAHEAREKEDGWVANFVTSLAGVIGNIGRRK
jgi:hypothetical protein